MLESDGGLDAEHPASGGGVGGVAVQEGRIEFSHSNKADRALLEQDHDIHRSARGVL